MNLPGLIRVEPKQHDVIDKLSHMMGKSFLEEGWTKVWLEALDDIDASKERKLEISSAIIKSNFTIGAPYECVYMLPDMSGAIGGYLSTDLQGRIWNDLEDESTEAMARSVLSQEEQDVLMKRAEQMATISNFKWMADRTKHEPFIHFFAIGVDTKKRGSGTFRSLISPFLDYADEHAISCYLECYSDKTEGIYAHYGFETVERFEDPAFAIVERCMLRKPQ